MNCYVPVARNFNNALKCSIERTFLKPLFSAQWNIRKGRMEFSRITEEDLLNDKSRGSNGGNGGNRNVYTHIQNNGMKFTWIFMFKVARAVPRRSRLLYIW